MCPGVLGADKEVSPTVSGLCLVSSGKSFLADALKLTFERLVFNITSHKPLLYFMCLVKLACETNVISRQSFHRLFSALLRGGQYVTIVTRLWGDGRTVN